MQATLTNKTNKNGRTGSASRMINIVLWVLQVLLAVVFLFHGWMMVSPPAELVELINAQLGVAFRLFIGVAELLAVFGLILPGATRILPWLTPLAAAGLMIVMASACVLHTFRGETSSAITTVVLLVIITAVAYMRWKVVPFTTRTRG